MRFLVALPLFLSLIVATPSAYADESDEARAFIEREQGKLGEILKKAPSPARESELHDRLDVFVDFDHIVHRIFGDPCPFGAPACVNTWKDFTEAQRSEMRVLVRKVIEKNYKKNLDKTLNYDVTFKTPKSMEAGFVRVKTVARSRKDKREPETQIDYVVQIRDGGCRVVDILTEGSSLTKNSNKEHTEILQNPAKGYSFLVKKLNEKLASK